MPPLKKKKAEGMTRRMVLAATGAAAVGATVVGGTTYVRWWNQPPGRSLQALSREEYEVVQRLAEAWMPPGSGPPDLSGAEAECGRFVDEVCVRMRADQRKLLKLALQIVDRVPYVTTFKTLRQLDRYEAAPHLEAMLQSDIFYLRQGVGAIMALIALGYTSHPEVAPTISPWFNCGFGR
ncbi:MAG: hypothetical protein H6732_12635 [Alphaproteobacteria bacterium]|nr:hypothetical protein [Alphaproteobacteria bacterium]